jgi:hypothetical protein
MPASASTAAIGSAARTLSTPAFCRAAMSRSSCVIFIDENFGPHIERERNGLGAFGGEV